MRTNRRCSIGGCGAYAALAAVALLSSCGGTDGDSVGIASGQVNDPVVVDVPIAYVKRPLPLDDDGVLVESDAREVITFNAGADVFVRERASPSALETNVTFEVTEGLADVKDLTVSFAGDRIAFALRLPPIDGLDDDEQPTWNIWEYGLTDASLRRVITSDISAQGGHDVAPAYLPDGRIVFSSTRQRTMKALLLDEGKPQFAAQDGDRNEDVFLLHVMDADGSDIEQISFNQNHDLYPTVMTDGRIVFTRWDNVGVNREMNLYRIHPDGTNLELLYGASSHATGSDDGDVHFLRPLELPDGRVLAKLQPFAAPSLGTDLVAIDTASFVNIQQSVLGAVGMPGPAQQAATLNAVRTDAQISLGGRYSTAFALFDGTARLFVGWSPCRVSIDEQIRPCTPELLADPAAVEAPPLYGIWVYDQTDNTQLPIVAPQEGIMYSELVAAQPRALPASVPAQDLDPNALAEGVGVIHIRNVYDLYGIDEAFVSVAQLADPAIFNADQRPNRFIRIVKAVSLPGRDVAEVRGTAFGPSQRAGMREIIGYTPIEPDGSVRVKVPANTAFAIETLNVDGKRRVDRHDNWLQLRPGEVRECIGCHERNADRSHGRNDAFATSNPGASVPSVPFPNTNSAYFADFGETMAEVRARIECGGSCTGLPPSVDIVFEDIWTDEIAAGRPADAPFTLSYADLATPAPVSEACQQNWTAACRTVIHYEQHIHPLWSLPRLTLADDGVTVLSDRTCSRCHNIVDEAGQTQVPPGQLDLSDGQSPDQADHFKAYRELYFGDNEQILNGDVLQDRLIEVGIDPETMEPIFETVPVAATLRFSAGGSPNFFARFEAGGDHAGDLSPAELRLLVEWVDIGGQYYNDPFAIAGN